MKTEEIDYKSYLKSKSMLTLTESGTDRVAWKKLFVELGVPVSSCYTASTIKEAEDILNSSDIDIICSSHMIGDDPTFSLVDSHIEKYPNRADYFCFLVSEKNSLALAAVAAENDLDGLLVKPYNQQDLNDTIVEAIKRSITLKDESRLYYESLGNLRSGNLDLAQINIENFTNSRPESPNGFYLKGILLKKQDKINECLESWKNGLTKDPKHHKILCSLVDTYSGLREFETSYQFMEVLTNEYPINPSRIPDIIRASLATKNYKNLIQFCETILTVGDDLISSRKPIAAALTISGKYLLANLTQENRDLIIHSSKKAIELSGIKSKIALGAMENLLELEKYEIIKTYIDELPTENLTLDLLCMELQVQFGLEPASSVFVKAQNLVKVKKVTPKIYQILLITAKQLGKTPTQIEDMLFDGIKLFPDEKKAFELLVQ